MNVTCDVRLKIVGCMLPLLNGFSGEEIIMVEHGTYDWLMSSITVTNCNKLSLSLYRVLFISVLFLSYFISYVNSCLLFFSLGFFFLERYCFYGILLILYVLYVLLYSDSGIGS